MLIAHVLICFVFCRPEKNPTAYPVHETVPCGINTDIDLQFEPEYDDEIIKNIDATEYGILLYTCNEIHLIQLLFRIENTKSCITLLG